MARQIGALLGDERLQGLIERPIANLGHGATNDSWLGPPGAHEITDAAYARRYG